MIIYLRGRRFSPAAFALMLATGVSGWNRIYQHVDPFYTLLGVIGLIIAIGFAAAWHANQQRLLRWCFLGSTALWMFVAGSSWSIIHSNISAALALAWAVLAAGSYWLESSEREVRR